MAVLGQPYQWGLGLEHGSVIASTTRTMCVVEESFLREGFLDMSTTVVLVSVSLVSLKT